MFDLEQNELSQALFEQSEDAILIVRLRDLRILEANRVAHRLSVTPPPKLLGHPLTALVKPLDEDDFQRLLLVSLDAEQPRATATSSRGDEYYLHCGDGRALPIKIRVGSLPTARGDAHSLVHLRAIHEASEPRSLPGSQDDEAGRRQKPQYTMDPSQRRLLDNLPEMIWMCNTEKVPTYLNRAWFRFTGEDGLGNGWEKQIHPRDLDRRKRIFENAFAQQQPFTTEYRLRRRDGEYRWILDSGICWTDDQGRFAGYLGSCFDITERRRSQQAVQKADTLRQAAFQHSPAGILVADSTDVVIRLANPAALEMRGPTDRSLSNIPATQHAAHWQFLNPDGRPCNTKDLPLTRAVVRGETVHSQPLIIRRDDGSRRYVIANAAPIREGSDGTITGGIAVLQDTTQQREADKVREELITELEQKNAELERFTYTVSHDLKSPLITIRGFSTHLAEDALAGRREQMQDDLSEITQAVDRMERLLSELLELSRIGRQMNPTSEFCLYQLACEAASQVLRAVGEHRPKVAVSRELPHINADRSRIGEVFQNLIENAVKFNASKVEIGQRSDFARDQPVYFVRDNGLGIEPQYLEKIFDLFEQLDPNYEGSGVGLAISRRIVEVHGGQLWAESDGSHSGATFCFTLNADEARKV